MCVSYPEESSVVAPVPGRGVEHVWRQNIGDDADDVTRRKRLANLALQYYDVEPRKELTRGFVPAQPS